MAGDSTSKPAWSGRRPRLAVVVLWSALGLICATLALTALPVAFGDADASASTEERINGALDQTVGDALQRYGAGGITGQTDIGSVRPYTNPSDEVQFRVDAETPSYWRTGAYDVYTGDRWHRSADYQPYEMDDPPGEGFRSSRTDTVRMERATTRVPAAWRPVNVDGGGRKVTYDTQGGLQTDTLVQSGAAFRVQSRPPRSDPARLRTAGTAYPDSIERRYTDLPNSVPDRVTERTRQVTADAGTPYDAAVAIRDHLRSNKGYTLDVPPADGDVADELLFERDAAHCGYFATTMAVMLRSQGIPARYTVGYTTGDRIDGEYVVREANAHAWVEVFFPEVGWVSFDPTPSDDRTSAVADSLTNVSESELRTSEDRQQSQDDEQDTFDDGGDSDESDEQSGEGGQNGLSISTVGEPIPGESTIIRVREDGRLASGATVLFNGEPVGQTGARGTVTATVPYLQTLQVTARPPPTPVGDAGTTEDRSPSIGQSEGTTETFDLPTTIDLSIEGRPIAGTRTTVTARLAGAPVADATIRRDGEVVGTTSENGTTTLALPEAPETEFELAADRGAATGSVTIALVELAVDVDAQLLPLPSRSMTVTATANGTPVAGQPVLVDGEPVAASDGTPVRTGTDGTATWTAPSAFSASVAVGGSDSVTVRPLTNLIGLLLGGSLAVVAGTAGLLRARSVRSRNGSLSGWLIDRAFGAADRFSLSAARGERSVLRRLLDRLRSRLERSGSAERAVSIDEFDDGDPTSAVRSAWVSLLAIVPGVASTSTPRSVADRAIAFGFPRRAVERVLTTFRALEYGGRTPIKKRDAEQLRDALSELRAREDEVDGRD